MNAAFEALIDHPAWMTGVQIAFVRKYMGLTQDDFAKGLGLTTHAQVSRWEKKGKLSDKRETVQKSLSPRVQPPSSNLHDGDLRPKFGKGAI